MLHEFLAANHDELVKRCKAKVAKRPAPEPTATELEFGIPLFIDQLVTILRAEEAAGLQAAPVEVPSDIGTNAGKHGTELLLKGFTVDQVVHDYGDLCQALTELAHEQKAPITVDEFHTFNRCLDNAIADAVTEFGRVRDRNISDESARTMNERLGSLAHEQRNLLNTAMLALHAVKCGSMGMAGATGAVLDRSLHGLQDLTNRSLADVRLTAGLQLHREPIPMDEFLEEVRMTAAMEATDRELGFTMKIEKGLAVDADRQMLSSAIANLLQNAFKFTHPHGHVSLTAHAVAERVVIDIEDECGGLVTGKTTEEIFRPFEQQNGDRTGLGLGLSVSRRGVEANGGKLTVHDIPGKGCVFTIDLPAGARS